MWRGSTRCAAPSGGRSASVAGYYKSLLSSIELLKYYFLLITLVRYILPSFVVGSVLYNLPKFFELEMNETGTDIEPTALRAHPLYSRGYIFW